MRRRKREQIARFHWQKISSKINSIKSTDRKPADPRLKLKVGRQTIVALASQKKSLEINDVSTLLAECEN